MNDIFPHVMCRSFCSTQTGRHGMTTAAVQDGGIFLVRPFLFWFALLLRMVLGRLPPVELKKNYQDPFKISILLARIPCLRKLYKTFYSLKHFFTESYTKQQFKPEDLSSSISGGWEEVRHGMTTAAVQDGSIFLVRLSYSGSLCFFIWFG